MTTTELRIERMHLPPAIVPGGETTQWGAHDTYAEVSCGGITAEVVRFAYWHHQYPNCTDVEETFEVRVNGLPDHCGTCDVCAEDSALLLDEARE
jgi:hypothetical protein